MTLAPQAFPQTDTARAARVFAGDLVVYRQVPALEGLRDLAVRRIEAAFQGRDPLRAHESLAPPDYQRRVKELHRAWRRCPEVRQAWRAVFRDVGLDPAGCFCDSFHLRVLPPRRALSPEARKAYPKLPGLLERPEAGSGLPVVIAPGDLLCFSAQHLHGGQPNTSAVVRFSLECRSVNLADVRQRRAAPNSDGAAPCIAWHWFKRLDDGLPLDEALASSD